MEMIPGYTLGNTYQIIEEIGSGGGGIVYRARHLRLDIDVVVKKVRDEVLDVLDLEREKDILKNLKHPYLPRLYDFVVTPDGVYTVIDFIPGQNLAAIVKEHGKFSQKEVLRWAIQLGEALSYLHSQKPPVIHSDIKPQNIMVTPEGDVCLIDFNISLAMGSSQESAVGISLGFSPPEQYREPAAYADLTNNLALRQLVNDGQTYLRGEAYEKKGKDRLPKYTQLMGKGIDARSDIYSLGMVLAFALTGDYPDMDFEQRAFIKNADARISDGFSVIIEKMVSLSPKERFQDGTKYLKAVRNCYRFDKAFLRVHRREIFLQLISCLFITAGIFMIAAGAWMKNREVNESYYCMIKDAEKAIAAGRFREATEQLAEAKALLPERVEAYTQEVYECYIAGNYERCVSLGENYISTYPFVLKNEKDETFLGDMYYVVGNAYFEQGDYPSARNIFVAALQMNEGNGLYFRDYAITLAKLGQTEEAENILEKAVSMGIAEDSLFMVQGEIAHMLGRTGEAVAYFKKALAVSLDVQVKKRAVLLCADTYRDMGVDGLEQGIMLLEQSLGQSDIGNDMALAECLAGAYIRKAETDQENQGLFWQKALTLFQRLVEQGYTTYRIQENMAILYENLDQFSKAEGILLELTENYPRRYEPYKRLALLEADMQQKKEITDRDYHQMQEYYNKAIAIYPEEEQDMEMQMLDQMMREIRDGGWL